MIDVMELDDTKELVRDIHSKALLNINTEKQKDHRRKRDAMKLTLQNKTDVELIKNDINIINSELSEIKNLLLSLVNK